MKRLRLRKIIAKIKKDPKCWNQNNWHCGTSHCIAVHAQIDAGKYKEEDDYDTVKVWDDAEKHLELTYWQADYLFEGDRTLKEIIKFEKTNGEIPELW